MSEPHDPSQDQEPSGTASRRTFLARTGAAAGGLLLAGAGPAAAAAPAVHTGPRKKTLEEVIHEGAAQQQYPPVVRSDVTTYTQSSVRLNLLKQGVAAMRLRPAVDRRSWDYQAKIHDIWCDNPPQPDKYVHYSWRFLVWHRAYLYFNEQILQQAAGSTGFAIPYWNWTDNLKLPAQYYGTSNPLNDPTRVMGPNDSLDPRQTAISGLLALTDFPPFGGTVGAAGGVETGPHNYVHRSVGGDMGDFATAGLDPIFWAHHCNVDRVWWLWLNQGGGRSNPVDPAWLTQSYPFIDTQGNQFTIPFSVAAGLPVSYNPPPRVVAISSTPGTLSGPKTVRAMIDPLVSQSVASRMASATPPPVLHVSGVTVPPQPVTVNVFADQPEAGAGTSTAERGFVGSFTLIPSGHQHDVDLRVPLHQHVPDLLQAMAAPSAREGVSFTLVPVGATGVTYQGLELEI
jgi:hypothetical protein